MAATDEPPARKPQVVSQPPPPRKVPPTLAKEPEIKPGDLICGVCGAGNEPTRRFCRRCGNSLSAAKVAVAVPRPWYRRMFGRQQQVMVAGERPKSMGTRGRSAGWWLTRALLLIVVLAILLPVVGYFAVPSFRSQVDELIGSGGTKALLLQHPANNALDGNFNTFWLADTPADGRVLKVTLDKTTDLAGVEFSSGATADEYARFGRPKQVELIYLGNTQPEVLTLRDDPAAQLLCVKPPQGVSTFNIKIDTTYPGQGPNGDLTALREVEFKAVNCHQ